ncbi:MAG: AAA family ATPase [Clostridiales bacterium]|nr:AAA family ATPase [Clostridiales bacterium]MDD6872158.1 AAA family ATPase [Clostridiales bacterium]MDD7367453.1 AAA family ATPase [Clostridiales bacterium]MDY2871434.1 AAA family ATPase [Eubacteriales bacterium]
MSRIIAVSNQKGGVGKTTTSVNLAACVAEKGKRVLLVDIDPQGNASSGLGVAERTPSVYDVLLGEESAGAAVRKTEFDNLSVLPSDMALAGAEIELVAIPERETLLRKSLEAVRDQYDYIFIDCPPSLSLLTLNAMTAADSVLIPIQCEYYALEGVGQLMNTLQLVKKRLNPALEIEGVVLTMLDGRTNLGLQVVQEVKKYFKSRVYGAIIPRNVRLSEAPSHGEPINVYDSRSTGAEAYRALAAEFIEWNEGEEE